MTASTPFAVRYRVAMSTPHAHLYEVEATFSDLPAGEALLRLPVWIPGSYLVREYARHLQDLAADVAGTPLAATKIDKATWRVALPAGGTLRVRYRVYANELTVRTSHLDGTHGYFNGPTLFLYLEEHRRQPALVELDLPPGWRATCALESLPSPAPGIARFAARDYDELVDSPVECGMHELLGFEVPDPKSGAPRRHRMAIWGAPARADRDRLLLDVRRIVEEEGKLFGELPYEDYTFLFLLAPGARGGLEHHASSTVLMTPHAFGAPKPYEELLELVAHEFFHLWNVKRIHPEALGPFDYGREAYTRSLWVAEGVTSHYDRLLVRRAGLVTAKRYLEWIAEDWARLLATPGRNHQSLEEASFDTWIKQYRPDENTVNSAVSYYLKGALVALVFDLQIRRRSMGGRSLDDVMRHLWARYGKEERGYRDADVQAELEAAAGVPLGDLFDTHVRGHGEIDLDGALRTVGLELRGSWARDDGNGGEAERAPAWLGATTRSDAGRLWVASAIEGGPAVRDGLYAGDELLALDGYRIGDERALRERLAALPPGENVRVTVFRREQLVDVPVRLGERPRDRYAIVPRADATPEERSRFEAWLSAPFPEV